MDWKGKNNDDPEEAIVQDYFSSMSPLSSRIYADIIAVEKSIHESKKTCPFSERCAMIDKTLIDDVLQKNAKQKAESDEAPAEEVLHVSETYATDLLLDVCSIDKSSSYNQSKTFENELRNCNILELLKDSQEKDKRSRTGSKLFFHFVQLYTLIIIFGKSILKSHKNICICS